MLPPALSAYAADAVLLAHLAFILFAAAGGLAVPRWPRVAWLHLPAAGWAALIELSGWTCPLTPLEVWLRRSAGQAGFQGGFIEHYLGAIVYPPGLTRTHQLVLGGAVLLANLLLYGIALRRRRR